MGAVPAQVTVLTLEPHTATCALTSAAGGVFFREFAAMGPPQAIGYTCGIALCLLGLGVLGHAHATEAVEQGERLSTLGEKSPEPPTPAAPMGEWPPTPERPPRAPPPPPLAEKRGRRLSSGLTVQGARPSYYV